jgi:hypothetical protein
MIGARTRTSCPHEDDVLELVAVERWTSHADPDLRAHAAQCEVCRDLVVAASAVVEWRETTPAEIRVPDPAVVWYRAQMRARADAAHRATRPLVAAQVIGAACIAMVLLQWTTGAGAGWLTAWWTWLSTLVPAVPADLATTFTLPTTSMFTLRSVMFAVLPWLLLVPVAFWVARRVDQ